MKILIMMFVILLAAALVEIYRELHSFQVTRYIVASDKLSEGKRGRIIFLSDLHNHLYGEKNKNLLKAIEGQKPDYILIGGDMLVGKNGYTYDVAEEFVKSLAKMCPVYYANGNHEQRMKEQPDKYEQSYEKYKESLTASGVHFLENESVQISLDLAQVTISGLEIPRECYTHFRKIAMRGGAIEERIGKCSCDRYQILLAHNPSYMREYIEWGADLILSGHLHGGIVRIPGIAGVISPNLELLPKYSGDMYKEGKQTVIVSKGLGNHTIPVRLFNPAEIVVIDLEGTK